MKAAVVAILFLATQVHAAITAAAFIDQGRKPVAESREAAEVARTRLGDLIARHADIKVGVQIETMNTNSEVLPIYVVGLDALKGFANGSKATDFMKPTGRAYWLVYYPANNPLDHHVTLSSVELRQTPTGWQTARMGGATYAENVWRAMEKAGHPKDVILVQVPALALHFIGFVREGELVLSLIEGSPEIKIEQRQARPADDLFLMLAPETKSHNDRYN